MLKTREARRTCKVCGKIAFVSVMIRVATHKWVHITCHGLPLRW